MDIQQNPLIDRKFLITLLIVLVASAFPSFAAGTLERVEQGKWGITINYPGIGIKYFMSDQTVIELKGQADKQTQLGGLRFYRYVRPVDPYGLTRVADKLAIFLGVEGDYVKFKGDVTRGTGGVGEVFCGFEFFFTPFISFQEDFGPAFIYLKDKDNPVSINGIEFVSNTAINFYWGGPKNYRAHTQHNLEESN